MILPAKQPFAIVNGAVQSAPSDRKISGTTLAGVVGRTPWDTPFAVACKMLNVYREDISDKPAVRTGRILEHVIVDYVNSTQGLGIMKGDDLYGSQPDDYNTWMSHFDDPDFSGHVDGVLADGTIVEVKTGGSPAQWVDKDGNPRIPEHYHIQASLYARMTGASSLLFILGVVDDEARKNPHKWVPSEDNVFLFPADVHPEIDDFIRQGREFRMQYTTLGYTPRMDTESAVDNEILKAVRVQVDTTVQGEYARYVDEYSKQIRDLQKLLDEAKDSLKLAVAYTGTDTLVIPTQTGRYEVTTKERSTTRVDTNALKHDGLYDKYSTKSSYQVLDVKTL